ncbi:MAG: M50 family metallopeptidase [Thermaceae bacterium]
MSLVWFILIIGVSVFVHELGHYLAARLQGVRVKAFSVGFGPALLKTHRFGTEWRLSAIPLGGYADIEGLLPEEKGLGYDRLPFLGKLLVLLSGVLMNLLLALLLLAYLFYAQGVPEATGRAAVVEVVKGSPAERAGIHPGDTLVAVDGTPLNKAEEINRLKTPGVHTLTLKREGKEVQLTLEWKPGYDRLGVVYTPEVVYRRIGLAEALGLSASRAFLLLPQMVKAMVGGLFSTLAGKDGGVVGPVGLVSEVGKAASQGPFQILELTIAINLSLALFNLLPIPALDGGRILFLFLSRLLRLRPEQEAMAHYLGFLFLLFLILVVTLQDLRRILGG